MNKIRGHEFYQNQWARSLVPEMLIDQLRDKPRPSDLVA